MFITFEGIDGSGKSTQLDLFAKQFSPEQVIITREPYYDTPLGKALEPIIKYGKLDQESELLLFYALRREHLIAKDIPNVLYNSDTLVLCDRYTDSTIAYASDVCLIGEIVEDLNKKFAYDIKPHLTFVLDIDPKAAQERLLSRGKVNDKFDLADLETMKKRRQAFLKLAGERHIIIDASKSIDEVQLAIQNGFEKYKQRMLELSSD